MELLILFFAASFAGAGKVVQDTIAHHWERSIFTRIKWDWLREWLKLDEKPKEHPIPIYDGWHVAGVISLLSGWIGISYVSSRIQDWGRVIILFVIVFVMVFELFYKKYLLLGRNGNK